MPNSAYTRLNDSFGFCPTAIVISQVPVQATATSIVITGLSASFANPVRAGMAAMINDEIVIVEAVNGNNLTISRGCADTVPQFHFPGSRIWFFEDSIGRVSRELTASETSSIKVLPRTSAGGIMPIEASPPIEITTNFRFARPYPPGRVMANGQWWFSQGLILTTDSPLQITWAHRNRISQSDLLVHHDVASIAPEPGTQYRLTFYRTSDNGQRAMHLTSDDSFVYTAAAAENDLGVLLGPTPMYAVLRSVRDNLDSRSSYRIDFVIIPTIRVTANLEATYDITPAVTRTLAVTYNLTPPVTRTLAVTYNLTPPVTRTLAVTYNLTT